MILEYEIPNGTMIINADVFFEEAEKSKIRKMLKDYRSSYHPEPELLIQWLTEKIEYEVKATKIRDKYSWCLQQVKNTFGIKEEHDG